MRHFYYELSKKEKKEVEALERLIFYPNGFPKEEVINNQPTKALRLEELYKKRNELAVASQN